MQEQLKQIAIVTMCAVVAPSSTVIATPQPFIQIADIEMPQYVSGFPTQLAEEFKPFQAVAIYHQLRKGFALSNTEMGKWLGVKRRSLYNWMNAPESSVKYGNKIEYRLDALAKLSEDMEPEHRVLIAKIAFSPIYGDPSFGNSITNGESSKQLIAQYNKLFDEFESYRRTLKLKSDLI